MTLKDLIFGKKAKKEAFNYFQTLTGYAPQFSTWQGGIYEAQACRSAIESIAKHVSKLNIEITGSANQELMHRLKKAPNSFTTWSKFLGRLASILYATNTAFIVPIIDNYDRTVGLTTVYPDTWELVETNGTIYVRFHFKSGETAATELARLGILTRFQCENDFFGENNQALMPTLDLIHIQNQAIREGVKNSASFRFVAQKVTAAFEDDIKKEQQEFNENRVQGGVVQLFPSTWQNLKQVEAKPYTVSAEDRKAIDTSVNNYFGTNEKIIQGAGTDEDLDVFFESTIEPFAIQVSEVITNMLFTLQEQNKNAFTLSANRLQYMSAAHKVTLARDLGDRGYLKINEVRQLLNYPLLPEPVGSLRTIRGEYYMIDDNGNVVGKETQNNGAEPEAAE